MGLAPGIYAADRHTRRDYVRLAGARFDEVIAKIAATLVPGGRFVLLDLRMPDNWLRHLAPALIWLVRPFAVSLEVTKRQPWKALRQHFPQYSYQMGYLGIVYIAIGQQRGRADR